MTTFSNYTFDVPDAKKVRVIINTDAKCEADDQYAIVHALLTPKFLIKGIIGAHFGSRRNEHSMQESYDEVKKVISLMDLQDEVDVYRGATKGFENETTPELSEGAELIVREAMADDSRPLYVTFQGPITDMAAAYMANPDIAGNVTAIWIGGGAWPEGGQEFNLSNDVHAANVVLKSDLDLWLVPRNTYSTMRVSLAELQARVEPYGEIGKYLFRQLVEFNEQMGNNPGWPRGESWCLGDSPTIGLMLDSQDLYYDWVPAPIVTQDLRYVHEQNNRPIRVYNQVDVRFILEDFFSKMKLNYS
jgi:inosine-uridine nucleoside N-ribohydrolase